MPLELFNKKLTKADWSVITANLIPVFGVWFLGWNARDAFLVYAMETLLIGIITVLLMNWVIFASRAEQWGKQSRFVGFIFVAFFVMHFGIFAGVQTGIFSAVSGLLSHDAGFLHFFLKWYTYINNDIAVMLGGFLISYFVSTVLPFFQRESLRPKPESIGFLMFMPYGRILIQQVTVIFGSMFLAFNLGGFFMLVFASAKIVADVYLNFGEMLWKKMQESRTQEKNSNPGARESQT